MSLRRIVLAAALWASAAAVACGFTEVGALDEAADAAGPGPRVAEGGAASVDGASDASIDSPASVPVCGPATCSLPSATSGWELVLLATALADACPPGFDPADAIENPTAGANACTCAACVTTGTSCSTGSIPTDYDQGSGTCGTSGTAVQGSGGACVPLSGQLGVNARADAPQAVKGTCTSASSPVAANVSSQARRVCTPQASTCAGEACGAAPSLRRCLAKQGDVACPAATPTKHLVGAAFTLQCPSCGCSITSAVCGGTLEAYPQSNCGGTPVVLPVGVCEAANSASVGSTKWKPTVVSEQCAIVPMAPAVTLTSMQTVCCP